jgi:hypothetical protein
MSESASDGPSAAVDAAEKKSRSSGGPNVRGMMSLLGILVFLIQPLIIISAAAGILAFEKRKVRVSRWLFWAVVIAVLGILAAGASVTTWASWIFAPPSMPVFGDTVAETVTDKWPGLTDLRSKGILNAALISVPIGFLITAGWGWWRSYQIKQRGTFEGADYDAHRPVGILDKARAKRNTAALTNGTWSEKNPGRVAVGIGKYGAVAHIPTDETSRTTVILGATQSGKTRTANSIADQIVHDTGGGNITLDFKGDADMAMRKAELAAAMGVPFKHFELTSKSGAHYRRPHPYAPPMPAHYDPFSKGNGNSKAAMLLNSVDRDGDAAAYFRRAEEAVKLAWDIASLNGVTARTHPDGTPLSGLEVLSTMLDPDTLFAEGEKVTPARVKADNPALTDTEAERRAASIINRIRAFSDEVSGKGSKSNSLLASSLSDVRSTVSGYINDPAAGAWLNSAAVQIMQIDLTEAILGNEIILFTLPAQDYPEMAAMIGTLVMLDLGNAVTTLRHAGTLIADNPTRWTPKGTDKTPWNPLVFQVEELGSIRSTAAAGALLGLLNKSADVEIRAIISSQSVADLNAVDGTGIWRQQVFAQAGNVISLTTPEASDVDIICQNSGTVDKKIPVENTKVENNRFRLNLGASAVESVRGNVNEMTRIPPRVPKSLGLGTMETLWVNSRSPHPAVHTLGEEGPNQWYEVIIGVPVHEPAHHWDPFDQPSEVVTAVEEKSRQVLLDLRERIAADPVLHTLTTNRDLAAGDTAADNASLPGTTDTAAAQRPPATPAAGQWNQLTTPDAASGPTTPAAADPGDGWGFDDVPLPDAPPADPDDAPAAGAATEVPATAVDPAETFTDPFGDPFSAPPAPADETADAAGDPFGWNADNAPAADPGPAQTPAGTPADPFADPFGVADATAAAADPDDDDGW